MEHGVWRGIVRKGNLHSFGVLYHSSDPAQTTQQYIIFFRSYICYEFVLGRVAQCI